MFLESVFDGDHESTVIFHENMHMKNENRKIQADFDTQFKTSQELFVNIIAVRLIITPINPAFDEL